MRHHFWLVLGLLAAMSAARAADVSVGMSISVGEPGFYGRLDIGNYPPPALVSPTPVIVQRVAVEGPPLYLRVPPGHVRQWSRYCARYEACGRPVYFVQDRWYQQVYVPQYRQHYRQGHGDHDRDDRREERGHGHGHGEGHGHD
jgi:hypothetical protein